MTYKDQKSGNSFKKFSKIATSVALVASLSLASQTAFAVSPSEAISIISNYAADDDSNTAPTKQTYIDAGVTGVTDYNVNDINDAVALGDASDVEDAAEIQSVVDGKVAALATAALAKIKNYTDTPSVTDYLNAGVEFVDADNLSAVNTVIAAESSTDKEDAAEIQLIVDAQITALAILTNYNGSGTALTLSRYTAAGITGVTSNNLAAINVLIGDATDGESDKAVEIQAIVTAANDAVATLAAYAGTGTAPTVGTYETAGITGVTPGNLAAINVLIGNAGSTASDSALEIQAIVDAANAALIVINLYDGSNTSPTLTTYSNAGITGVTEDNLNAINSLMGTANSAATDTAFEVQSIVNSSLGGVAQLAAYSGDGTAPSLTTYVTAGVLRVDANNLDAINTLIAAALPANSDSLDEIQGIVDAQITALAILTNYNGSGTALTLSRYTAAGITGVTSNNLAAINVLIGDATDGESDKAVEIQAIVTAANDAVATLAGYTGSNTAPTLTTYTTAGITGVTANNLVGINVLLAPNTSADLADEIQAIVTAANAAVATLAGYTGSNTAPTLTTYTTAGITGVTANNLVAINVLLAPNTAADLADEIQAIVTAANAALTVINLYDGTNTAPTLTTYTNAGITGVSAANLAAINSLMSSASVAASDTALEVQAIVDTSIGGVALIAAYSGVGTPPSLTTYVTAGVLRVDANNLAAINTLIAAALPANSDSLSEIQGIVDAQIVALAVLTNYTGATALTLAQYTAAGITGVTATNLSKVNIAIAAATIENSNTALEVQTIVDGLNAVTFSWTKRISTTEAKLYAKNIVGAGKVQFFLNGKEIAWVNATDAGDPKLRAANGAYYLVRTVALASGKNVLEIKIKGVQVRRVVYSR